MMNRYFQIASALLFLFFLTPGLLQGQGHLVLIGGGPEVDGGWSDDPYTWGIEHAPNGRVAIVTTDTAPGQSLPDYFMDLGADTARNLIIDDTATAHSVSTYDTLMSYDAIFLTEGSRWEYIDTYESTLTETAIQQTYQQGGVIMGSAEGMGVLSGVSFTAENGPLYPKEALADPYDPKLQLDTNFLPLREGMIFDDRFVQKGRFGRMLGFIGRWHLDKDEDLLGIGVDDRMAFCLAANDTGIAMGSGAVSLLYTPGGVSGQPFTIDDQRLAGGARVTQLIDSCWARLGSGNTIEEVKGFEQGPLTNIKERPEAGETFLSGSNIPHENTQMVQGTVQKLPLDTTGPEVDTVAVISANDDLTLADSMKARYEAYGDLEASIVQAIPANANDPGMTQALERAELYFFVNSEYDKLMNTLGQGSLGQLLENRTMNTSHEDFPHSPKAFMGGDARLAGGTFVRHYDSTNASFNRELEFEDGLGIMNGTVILPHCFDTAYEPENAASAIPYAMLKDSLPYGIQIPRESYGHYTDGNWVLELNGFGPYPLIVWDHGYGQDEGYSFVEEPVTSGSSPRQIAGFENMSVHATFKIVLKLLEGLDSRDIEEPLSVELIQNPVGERLRYRNPHREELSYRIHDVQGKALKRGRLEPGRGNLSLEGLESGVHILRFQGENGQSGAERFVKQ